MANKVITAEARIVATDQTGSAFESAAAKIRKLEQALARAGQSSAQIDRATGALKRADAQLKSIDKVTAARPAFLAAQEQLRANERAVKELGRAYTEARKRVADFDGMKSFTKRGTIAKEIADARQEVQKLERELGRAHRSRNWAATNYQMQKSEMLTAARAVRDAGTPISRLPQERSRIGVQFEEDGRSALRRARAAEVRQVRAARDDDTARRGAELPIPERERSETLRYARAGVAAAAGAAGVHGVMDVVRGAAKETGRYTHERVRMAAGGMSPDDIQHASEESGHLSSRYRAFGQTDIMHMLRNARSVVGSYEEAAHIMEPMLQLRTVALGANPHKAEQLNEDFDKLIKGMEIKGVTQDLPKFTKYMDGMAKAINVFGDTLRPTDYYEMFKYGRQATNNLSEDYMNSVAPTIAQELGGSSAGTAQAAFFRAIVGGKMSNLAVNELNKIGLLDQSKVIKTRTGNVKGVEPGGIKGSRLAAENPYQWVQRYLLPAFQKAGITDPHDQQERIARVFSNQVAAQLVGLFATQQSRIDKDAALVRGAEGLGAHKRFLTDDPYVAWQSLKEQAKRWGNAALLGEAAAYAMSQVAKGLAVVTDHMNDVNDKKKQLDRYRANPYFPMGEGEGLYEKFNPQNAAPPEPVDARKEREMQEAIERKRADLKKKVDIERKYLADDEAASAARPNSQVGKARVARGRAYVADAERELESFDGAAQQREDARQAVEDVRKQREGIARSRMLQRPPEPGPVGSGPSMFGFGKYGLTPGPNVGEAGPRANVPQPPVRPEDTKPPPPVDLRTALGGSPLPVLIQGGDLKATVQEPIPVKDPELKGSAQVSVTVRVEGNGQVTGMSASGSGHIRADVGTSMAGPVNGSPIKAGPR